MLGIDAIRDTVGDILASKLGEGFSGFEIEPRQDQDGDPALFIKAFFRPDSRLPNGKAQLEAMALLRSRLLDYGEDRLPYLDLNYPTEENPSDQGKAG